MILLSLVLFSLFVGADALPNGAAACLVGGNSAAVGHGPSSGDLSAGGYALSVDGTSYAPGDTISVNTNTEYTIEVSGGTHRGILFRLDSGAVTPLGSLQPAPICGAFPSATHSDPSDKDSSSATVSFDATGSVSMDVSIFRSIASAQNYYSPYTFNVVDPPPTVAPITPTAAPVTPTAAPVTTTTAPVTPTSAPITPTSAPVVTTMPPVTPPTAPVTPTDVPDEKEQCDAVCGIFDIGRRFFKITDGQCESQCVYFVQYLRTLDDFTCGSCPPGVFVANTYQDTPATNDVEIIFDVAGPTVLTDGLEFVGFPANLYDIDVSEDSIKMTLVDNTQAEGNFLLPPGLFDRYYFGLPFEVTSAVVASPKGLIAEFTTVEILPEGFVLDVDDLLETGIDLPIEFDGTVLKVEIGAGADLSVLGEEINILLNPPLVFVANTYQDTPATNDVETIFDVAGPNAVTDGLEFVGFPANLYDIDVSEDSIKMTLVDNTQAEGNFLLPPGLFDRYYFGLPFDVTSAVVAPPMGLIAEFTTVEILPEGFSLDVADLLETGIELPVEFDGTVLKVEIGAGADLSVLGEEINILLNPPQVFVANTYQDTPATNDVEIIFDVAGPSFVTEGLEFVGFPANLYDIDVSEDSIKMTLVNNTQAEGNFLLPPGLFDRYYFGLSFEVTNAVVAPPKGIIAEFTTVEILPEGFSLDVADLLETGINLPVEFDGTVLKVEIGAGADLSVLGEEINILLNPPQVFVANTYQDTPATNDVEIIFDVAGPNAVTDGLEFVGFPANLYDIDVSEDSIKMTLVDNTQAEGNFLLPPGLFDRYYFGLSFDVTSAVVASPKGLIAEFTTVEILPEGFVLDVGDLLETGIDLPIAFDGTVLKVEIGAGADLSVLGEEINIILNPQVFVANTYQDTPATNDVEIIFDVAGPNALTDGLEFVGFPANLYDIDITEDSIKMTLVDNTQAEGNFLLPPGLFDRYYFGLPFGVTSAVVAPPKGLIAEFTTVEILPEGFVLDVGDLLETGIDLPLEFDGTVLKVEIGAGADLSVLGEEINIILNPQVFVANTYQDTPATNDVETIFDVAGPNAVTDGLEFVGFPANLYDIDVTEDSIKMTLVDNTQAEGNFLLPPGLFDRYYFGLPFNVTSAIVASPKGLIAEFTTVEILPEGFSLDVADLLGTGIELPVEFDGTVLKVEIGAGADLSVLGEEINIILNPQVFVANTYQDTPATNDVEIIFDVAGPNALNDGLEFVGFPANLYDIDVTEDSIKMTLVDNTQAEGNFLLPPGLFDRYYFGLPFDVTSAVVASPKGLIAEFTTVEILPEGFVLDVDDLLETGIDLPIEFSGTVLKVEIGAGADLSVLGEEINIELS